MLYNVCTQEDKTHCRVLAFPVLCSSESCNPLPRLWLTRGILLLSQTLSFQNHKNHWQFRNEIWTTCIFHLQTITPHQDTPSLDQASHFAITSPLLPKCSLRGYFPLPKTLPSTGCLALWAQASAHDALLWARTLSFSGKVLLVGSHVGAMGGKPSTLPLVGGLLPRQPSGNCQAHFWSSSKSCNSWQDLGCLYSPFPGGMLLNYAQGG